MRLIHISAALVLLTSGAAIAQTAPKDVPGGTLPTAQSPCGRGYSAAVQDGRMASISAETMKAIDTNNDGRVSKTEFDAACAKKLFDEGNKS